MSREFKVALGLLALLLILYALLRLGFYISNTSFFGGIPTGEILFAFVYGMRFDVAALLMLNAPVLLLFLLPGKLQEYRVYRMSLFVLFVLLNLGGIILNVVDFEYFKVAQRRLTYEPYTMLPDIVRMVPSLLQHYVVQLLILIALSLLFAAASWKAARFLFNRFPRSRILPQLFSFLLMAVVIVIGIRGGVQLRPIRISNAFLTDNRALGYLTLNSSYSVLRTYSHYTLPDYSFMPEDSARAIVQEMMFCNDERPLDPRYPFMRVREAHEPERRLNVVIFIMESWAAKYVGSITGKKSYTPFFDSLAQRGVLFTDFFANGQRSIEAVPSILASLPGLFRMSIIGSRSELSTFRGLGSILQEKGYTTSFHHGARQGSMGFDAYSALAGFSHYYSMADYPPPIDSVYDGSWGIADEPFFLHALDQINHFPQPFCSVIFSLSSHDPYTIPPARKHLFEQYAGETGFEVSLRYADFSLRQFFEHARTTPWYDSTIFLITADHTSFTEENNMYELYHIPLLIVAPSILPPRIRNDGGCHVDILPTIIDLLHIDVTHSSMGYTLLDTTKQRYAMMRCIVPYGNFTGTHVYFNDLEGRESLYLYHADPLCTNNLKDSLPELKDDLKKRLLAYIQTATKSINEDLIYRK